jgi:hypothetical protein
LGPAGFVAQFEQPNKPVILTGVVGAWPAFAHWQDPAYLAKVCGGAQFRATSLGASRAASFTMQDYHAYQVQTGRHCRVATARLVVDSKSYMQAFNTAPVLKQTNKK